MTWPTWLPPLPHLIFVAFAWAFVITVTPRVSLQRRFGAVLLLILVLHAFRAANRL